jgi:tRNA-splicing ligase RtcB
MNSQNNTFTIRGNHDYNTISQMEKVMEFAKYGALCADGHYGYSWPIGGVAACENQISPNGVGFDIGCGNAAFKLNIKYEDFKNRLDPVLDYICETFPFGNGTTGKVKDNTPVFDSKNWNDLKDIQSKRFGNLKDLASTQFCTIGSGNHYIDIFTDEKGFIWVGVHFGSRGLGHTIATWFFKELGAKDNMEAPPVMLDTNTDLGRLYIKGMELAAQYAYEARNTVCDLISKHIGGEVVDKVNNHHNFAWRERHFGEDYWVVRKGSTPLFPGQRGFVGSNMLDYSYILEGNNNPKNADLLYSTVHGAGRAMGRNQAKKSLDWNDALEAINKANVSLRGGAVDESPLCYKPIADVLEHHSDTFKVLHKLKPIGVVMAG